MSKDSFSQQTDAINNVADAQKAASHDDVTGARDAAPTEASIADVDKTKEIPATDGATADETASDARISPATFAETSEAGVTANTKGTRRFRAKFAATCAVVVVLLAAFGGIGYAWGWFAPPASPVEAQANNESSSSSENELASAKARNAQEKEVEATKEDTAAPSQQSSSASDESTTTTTDVSAGEATSSSAGSTETPSPSSSESSTSFDPAPSDSPSTESSGSTNAVPEPTTITVSVYVDSSRAASYGYASCLASTSVSLQPGASVYDALLATGVSVGGSSSYVRSIGGLAEFACGGGSGWLFFVNGSSPGYGCGSYQLYGGESIQWVYTLDMGNDL